MYSWLNKRPGQLLVDLKVSRLQKWELNDITGLLPNQLLFLKSYYKAWKQKQFLNLLETRVSKPKKPISFIKIRSSFCGIDCTCLIPHIRSRTENEKVPTRVATNHDVGLIYFSFIGKLLSHLQFKI